MGAANVQHQRKIPMLTLYKSLVRPLLEYSSALWSPNKKGDIQRLEEVQQSFVRKIKGVSRDYHTALKQLNLYSLERRRERYTILHIWKILESKTRQQISAKQSCQKFQCRQESFTEEEEHVCHST